MDGMLTKWFITDDNINKTQQS